MRTLLYIALSAAAFVAAACSHHEKDDMEIQADTLYHGSIKTLSAYTDSLAHAKDSATVHRIDKSLEEKLAHLNFECAPGAYLKISEGQNDTLANMTIRFAHLRDSLLYRLGHPLVLKPDSIAADSLTNNN